MTRLASILGLVLFCASSSAVSGADVEQRVNELLSKLSLEEKLDLLSGVDSMHVRENARVGIPRINMSDGPCGVHNYGPSTAYPGPIALAATFDVDLARRFGEAMGRDARARGVHFLLAPGLNIYRIPINGRNFEYLGEDPYLASRIVLPIVQGIQSQGVAATVKHFACNNQEVGRGDFDSVVDERTLNEIYLPAFKAAVTEGKAWAVMAAYNLLNGLYCSENKWLLETTLKQDWGFGGIVMSDWGATHTTLAAATGGLDLEMPGGVHFTREKLLPLIRDGRVTEAMIDDKVRRLLRVLVSIGAFDRPQQDDSIPKDDPRSREVALQIARQGIVLLKNDRQMLPLDRAKLRTIAVVGPNAHPAVWNGGGSGFVNEVFRTVSVLDGLRDRAGAGIKIVHVPFDPLENLALGSELTTPDGKERGLLGEYFANKNLSGPPALRRVDQVIDFDWTKAPAGEGLSTTDFSVRWTGKIRVPEAGRFTFMLQSDDGSRVFVDDMPVVDLWRDHGLESQIKAIDLAAGEHAIRVEYYQGMGDAKVRFGCGKQGPLVTPQQQAAIRSADAVIACVGFSPQTEFEGADRTFALPSPQDELIDAVVSTNPNTIVVLNAGGAVDVDAWLARVPALLHAWYPGQEGGTAVAEILFGDINPSGRLPATFEKRWEDHPAYKAYPQEDKKVHYREGIFVGYRGFDRGGFEPQFCFGHGLSYTTFEMRNLTVEPKPNDRGAFVVSLDVTNTGKRAGAEVVQVYVADVESRVPRPVRELKGFARVELAPNQTKRVTVTLGKDAFRFWDEKTRAWKVEPGDFEVAAGQSSRDLSLRKTVRVAD